MTQSSLTVRPVLSLDELQEHINGYVEVAQSFSNDPLPPDTAQRRLRWLTTSPGHRLEQVRGAYRDDKQIGGYRITERLLRIGEARLVTGCIGGVYTCEEARNQGVATALMHDAIAYAQERDYSLLLLDGIPKFYHRYGYCDVYDLAGQEIDCQAILALPPSAYAVRPFTMDDAASLRELYERHLGPYTGSFERSLERQIHWMQYLEAGQLLLALDPAGQARGYLFLSGIQARGIAFLAGTQASELVVDDWPATVALLQHNVRQVIGIPDQEAPFALMYNMPLASPALQWLAANLEVVDISAWDAPVFGWALRDQIFRHRDAGWMARLVSLPAVTSAMLPEWLARWRRSFARWSGDVSLAVGNEAFTLHIDDTDLALLDGPGNGEHVLRLTPQAFTQAIFGYRPLSELAQSGEQALSDDLRSVLAILFPVGRTWIPISDWF